MPQQFYDPNLDSLPPQLGAVPPSVMPGGYYGSPGAFYQSPYYMPTPNIGGNMQFQGGMPNWGWYPYQAGNYGGAFYGSQAGGSFGNGIDPFAGWQANSYGGPFEGSVGGGSFGGGVQGGVIMPQDTSQTPADVFAGLQEPVPPFSEPGALGDGFGSGIGAGGSAEFPGGSGVDAGGSAEFPGGGVPAGGSADVGGGGLSGGSGPMSPYDPAFPYGAGGTPAGFPVNYSPFAGGIGPQFSGGGSFGGPLSPQAGFFGLGAMDAAGAGIGSLGGIVPESHIGGALSDSLTGELGGAYDWTGVGHGMGGHPHGGMGIGPSSINWLMSQPTFQPNRNEMSFYGAPFFAAPIPTGKAAKGTGGK